jgi:hypothetical protein
LRFAASNSVATVWRRRMLAVLIMVGEDGNDGVVVGEDGDNVVVDGITVAAVGVVWTVSFSS